MKVGQLLTFVGNDGNNQMCHVSFSIFEAETMNSWVWFVHLLLKDLNSIQYKRWSFISNQQKVVVHDILSIVFDIFEMFDIFNIFIRDWLIL